MAKTQIIQTSKYDAIYEDMKNLYVFEYGANASRVSVISHNGRPRGSHVIAVGYCDGGNGCRISTDKHKLNMMGYLLDGLKIQIPSRDRKELLKIINGGELPWRRKAA